MPVLKTASPATLTGAPKLRPCTTVPSDSVSVIEGGSGCCRPAGSGRPALLGVDIQGKRGEAKFRGARACWLGCRWCRRNRRMSAKRQAAPPAEHRTTAPRWHKSDAAGRPRAHPPLWRAFVPAAGRACSAARLRTQPRPGKRLPPARVARRGRAVWVGGLRRRAAAAAARWRRGALPGCGLRARARPRPPPRLRPRRRPFFFSNPPRPPPAQT